MWIPSRVNKAGNVVPAFQVDECFADEVKNHKWYENSHGYLVKSFERNSLKQQIRLHRYVWQLSGRPDAERLDHINGDITDNRLENLRTASRILNGKNNRRRKPTKNGYPQGVQKDKRTGRWKTKILHRQHQTYLGTYDTSEEASAVYQNAKEILIEFANLPGYENVLTGGKD